jgi:hypothetical protein
MPSIGALYALRLQRSGSETRDRALIFAKNYLAPVTKIHNRCELEAAKPSINDGVYLIPE